MTLGASLNNALSGLTATAKGAQVVSSNLANALNEGYGVRQLELTSDGTTSTGGVKISGVVRHVDHVVIADRRAADADVGYADTMASFMQRLEKAFGIPGDVDSLTSKIDSFEAALVSAASRPDSEPRLNTVINTATEVARDLNDLSTGIQEMRQEADRAIHSEIGRLNTALSQVAQLNADIASARNSDTTQLSLMDERQRIIDQIAALVPVKLMPRDHGAVALVTETGAILVDVRPVEVGFNRSNVITPYSDIDAGTLSGITVGGVAKPTGERGPLAGGKIAALFEVRDQMLEAAQGKVDAVARDLVERFQDSGVDPTLAAGDAGLFTDGSGAFDAADELGLASRMGINAAADPSKGGHVWRLRDGLNAVSQGPSGDSTILRAAADVLADMRAPGSSSVSAVARTSSSLASDVLSFFGAERQNVEARLSFAATRQNELKMLELSKGVDSDQEMQKLLIIERAYAANARVIEVIDQMMDAILRI